MNTLDRLEKRFGRFAIPNVMRIFTVIYAIGLVLWIINPTAALPCAQPERHFEGAGLAPGYLALIPAGLWRKYYRDGGLRRHGALLLLLGRRHAGAELGALPL